MNYVTRRFVFDAAHRVLGHKGKCRHLHGHRYVVEVSAEAKELNGLGMVVDFSVLKEKVGWWIDEFLDHNTLLHKDDPLLQLGRTLVASKVWVDEFAHFGRRPYIMDENPTAENIAKLVFEKSTQILKEFQGLRVVGVTIWETENCRASYAPG